MKNIGEVADLAGVSTDTLRWYDRIGLLPPRARSEAGHRLYGTEELLRLREILIWRQLGFPLVDVAALIDDPGHDRAEALRRQRELAVAQRDKFHALTRGLDIALETVDAKGSVTENEVFAGFAKGLVDEDEGIDARRPTAPEARLIPTFALLSGRSQHGTARGPADSSAPRRIVATDPIRLGENLLALGILPVGVGSFFDQTTDTRFCPWPELVEAPIRERVKDVGWYGANKRLIAATQPDLILDLRFTETGQTLSEAASELHSEGACSYDDLCEIAPTALLEAPIGPPAFLARIEELATVLQVEDRIEPLLASWNARTRALREHVAGKTASALNLNPNVNPKVDPIGLAPNIFHEGQVFSVLGLELAFPSEGELAHWGGAIKVTPENVDELSAPTLFLTVEGQAPLGGPMHRLVSQGPLADLPAVRSERVFELGWMQMRSGWFTAHWQLDVIANAFGITRLRTTGSAAPVHLAIAPEGKAAIVSTMKCGRTTLSGPGVPELSFDLDAEVATCVDLSDAASDVCAFPQAYSLTTERSGSRRLTLDRESALEHIAQPRAAA